MSINFTTSIKIMQTKLKFRSQILTTNYENSVPWNESTDKNKINFTAISSKASSDLKLKSKAVGSESKITWQTADKNKSHWRFFTKNITVNNEKLRQSQITPPVLAMCRKSFWWPITVVCLPGTLFLSFKRNSITRHTSSKGPSEFATTIK